MGQDRRAKAGRGRQVSETVDALSELIASTDQVVDPAQSYMLGQLGAELVASGSQLQLSDAIVAINDHQQSEDTSQFRESVLAMMSGLLQGVLAAQQSAGQTDEQLTVRERVLNLLAVEPQNPTSLSDQIGCSPETVSRALGRLRKVGLVEPKASSELDDGRVVTYRLTDKGEQRQDDRFFGRLGDQEEVISDDDQVDQDYDFDQVTQTVTEAVAELNTHAPAIAATFYQGLNVLKDQAHNPELRAAAMGELSAGY
jgi:DNA-binding MarR family transcriptional regulator